MFQRVGYRKKEDDLILKEIKEVVKVRPSYGYKRVTVLVNKAYISKTLHFFENLYLFFLCVSFQG